VIRISSGGRSRRIASEAPDAVQWIGNLIS